MEQFGLSNAFNYSNTEFPDYIATIAEQLPQPHEYSITRLFNSIPQGGDEDVNETDRVDENVFGIPSILVSTDPPEMFKICTFDYSDELYSFMFKKVERALKDIECLDINYEPENGRWICVYGTMPIERQLSPAQMDIYHRKKSLFSYGWGHYDSKIKKNTFETIYLTNILKLPFNCFMKAGINDHMRSKLRTEISNAAQKKFPASTTGQTPWNEIYSFTEEDHQIMRGIRTRSKSEIVFRKDKNTNELNIFFNRISGDRNSASFIMRTIKESLEFIPADFLWSLRTNFLQFTEGCEYVKDDQVGRYILNDLIGREICSFMM